MTSRTSSINHLRALPPVFDLRDVEVICGVNRRAASQYCWRWRERGLIKPLGPRVGVHFNLIVDPDASATRLKEAIWKLLRRPCVVIGASALHFQGWTTQRPHQLELAVPVSRDIRSLPELDDVLLIPRSKEWFQRVSSVLIEGPEGFKTVPAAVALVDVYSPDDNQHAAWRPDPDDIDVPDNEADDMINDAAALLGIGEALNDEILRAHGLEPRSEYAFSA